MKLNENSPYLSIVIPFRNDNYIPNAIKKFNFSLNILVNQLESISLSTEIIIVDWNSPNPTKPLINEIVIKKKTKNVFIISYVVPKKIHLKYKGYQHRNINSEVAYNVGIRRSKGKFVLSKMGDTFYSTELIKFLGKKKLKYNEVYRVDRVDVNVKFHQIKKNWEKYFNLYIVERKRSKPKAIHIKACGDFLLMSRERWFKIKGHPENKSIIQNGADGEALYAAIGTGAKQKYLKGKNCVYKILHPNVYANRFTHKNILIKNNFVKIFLGNINKNLFQKFFSVLSKILFGILNLPKTKISNVRTRSIYRYFLIANFRRLFFGGSFIKSSDWGLVKFNLKKKFLINY